MTRRHLILAGLALTLLAVTGLVIQKELLLRDGRTVFLALAPVDPRSLIQGDYMTLRYAIADEVSRAANDKATDGHAVLVADDRAVATFRGVLDSSRPLAAGELLLRYRRRGSQVRLGAEAFFFQEGRADVFARAAYGELRVHPSGNSVLVGLRDRDLIPLK